MTKARGPFQQGSFFHSGKSCLTGAWQLGKIYKQNQCLISLRAETILAQPLQKWGWVNCPGIAECAPPHRIEVMEKSHVF
jgi:hypothetical protein